MYHHGWLMVGESNGNYRELINHARTAAYLQSSTALGCSKVYNVLDDGGCAAYPWVPPTMDGEPNEAAIVAPNGWYQQLYSSPELDEAPWYSAAYPESAEALGFWITEWTGLDSGHIRREVTPVASRGGQFGRSYSAAREMGLEIILLGESEAALDYLFRWLDATLSSVCYTCQTDSILIRRICPDFDVLDLDDVINGVVELRKVGMVSGLVWGAPPIERQGCYIRTVNVTLGAMDPCMYAPCSETPLTQAMQWDACFAGGNVNEDRSECRPSCSEMPGGCRTVFDYSIETVGASAPILTLASPASDDYGSSSIPLRIRTYANPNGYTADQLCGLPLLAELYVTALPAWSSFRYDMAGRQVLYRDAATGDWINGAAFIEPNTVGIPRWPALACGDYTTIVEPSSFCYEMVELSEREYTSTAYTIVPHMGRIYVGGAIRGAGNDNRTDALTSAGAPYPGYTYPTFSNNVYRILPYGDDQLLMLGNFILADGVTKNGLVRTDLNGNVDPTFNIGASPGADGIIHDGLVQDDGKIIVWGYFTTMRGVTQNRIARLDVDGSLDVTFNTGGTVGANGNIFTVVDIGGGELIVGGDFTTIRGTTKNRLAKISATDGSLITAYNTGGTVGVGNDLYDMALQPDGRLIIVGWFETVRGTSRIGIARLEADGTLDTTFVPPVLDTFPSVYAVALADDGTIYVGGGFDVLSPTATDFIHLSATGALLEDHDIFPADGSVRDLAWAPDGRLLIAGTFQSFYGFPIPPDTQPSYYIGAMLPNGQIDFVFSRTSYIDGLTAIPEMEMVLQERMGCV